MNYFIGIRFQPTSNCYQGHILGQVCGNDGGYSLAICPTIHENSFNHRVMSHVPRFFSHTGLQTTYTVEDQLSVICGQGEGLRHQCRTRHYARSIIKLSSHVANSSMTQNDTIRQSIAECGNLNNTIQCDFQQMCVIEL